jgi:microcystin-dependent protein
MSNYEATKYDFDAANLTGIEGIPTATIVPWSSSSVPSGFLECDGAAVSRSTYSALFAIIGTTYGSGDGSSTFNVPDLCDNVPVGKSNNKNVGSTGGANTVANTSTANATLSTAQLASHAHPNAVTFVRPPHGNNNPGPNPAVPSNEYTPWGNRPTALPNTGSGSAHSHNMSASFTGDATSVVQPYLTVIYIIKT